MRKGTLAYLILLVLGLLVSPAHAQDAVKVSGLAYVDYAYVLTSPVADEEGENGFGYRRLYLTTDYKLSDAFSGRVRLEANDGSTTAEGRPAPFVKDLYLTWKNAWAEGQDLVFGISSPPAFTVAEKVWGYRSLEKTIMDRTKVLSSRDFGVTAKGRLTNDGSLKYGLMLANNNSVNGEEDRQKRVYGQLEWYPSKQLVFTLGGDYADYDDERTDGVNLNLFTGYQATAWRVGAEGFLNQINLADAEANSTLMGLSVFAAVRLAPMWEAVARFDQAERDFASVETSESFVLAGVAYQPHPNVRFIPNILISKESVDDDALITGRVTLHMDF